MATQSKKKNRKRSTEQKALNFLCIMMAAIVIFVAVVCVGVNKKNNDLRKKETHLHRAPKTKPPISAAQPLRRNRTKTAVPTAQAPPVQPPQKRLPQPTRLQSPAPLTTPRLSP